LLGRSAPGTVPAMRFASDLRVILAACSAWVIGLVVAALVGEGGVARHGPLRRELRTLEREVDRLAHDNARRAEAIEALRTDPAYMESVVRDELGWVRPGEHVVVFGD